MCKYNRFNCLVIVEEEIKRLNMELASSGGYQAVGFSYDQPIEDSVETADAKNNGNGGG